MNLHSNEKKIILALVICMLVATIGSSFAYFVSSGAYITGAGGRTNVKTGNMLKVTYDAGTSKLQMLNAFPGTTESKNFAVKITPSEMINSIKYAIKLNITDNGFISGCGSDTACTEDLVYKLKDEAGNVLSSGNLVAKTGNIVLLEVDDTYLEQKTINYSLEISFLKQDRDQNYNSNKAFSASLEVLLAA